jgi:hypothetical protein
MKGVILKSKYAAQIALQGGPSGEESTKISIGF